MKLSWNYVQRLSKYLLSHFHIYNVYTYLNRSIFRWIKGLDVSSTGTCLFLQNVSLLFVYSIFFALWSDVEWIELCPYISRHIFPVVEARDWLSSCSLERTDWVCQARWPPLICTYRVESTSRLLPTVPMLIGCLSSVFMYTVGAATRHSKDWGRVHFNILYILNWGCFL